MERLGRGGFGSVFLARTLDAEPGDPSAPPEQVAVKVLGRAKGAHARTSLKQELGRIELKNIGIFALRRPSAAGEGVARVTAELYVESMELKWKSFSE